MASAGNDDGPYRTVIVRGSEENPMLYSEWCNDDGFHRYNDLPARTWRDTVTGNIHIEEWWQHNCRHRDGKPAIIVYDSVTGAIREEVWYVDHEMVSRPTLIKPARAKKHATE